MLHNLDTITDFVDEASDFGQTAGLAVITKIEGSSPRPLGTILAVREDGQWVGTLSGGCIEGIVAAEVLRVVRAGHTETLRLGVGSPLIDVRLPCGGGMELFLTPAPCCDTLTVIDKLLSARRPIALKFQDGSAIDARMAEEGEQTGPCETGFVAVYRPRLGVHILGNGVETVQLARLATTFGACVTVTSGERSVLNQLEGIRTFEIKTATSPANILADRWTAVVFLFHDHDWEMELLPQALQTEAFYVGAMGSVRTQRARLQALDATGLSTANLNRLISPVGLLPRSKDPHTLALSILAQIVSHLGEGDELATAPQC